MKNTLIILSLLLNLFQYNCYQYFDYNFWYWIDAINYGLMYFIMYLISENKWFRYFASVGILFSINDFIDMFTTPEIPRMFEYLFCGIGSLLILLITKPYAAKQI
jgi:hypothetical protein